MIQRYEPSSAVIEFSNGLDALNFLKSTQEAEELPEVIFLDINMPVMNGWEFMEEFAKIRNMLKKKIEIYKKHDIPLIELTDDDIQTLTGQKDHLVGKIQERYGIAKDEAEKQLAAWERQASDSWFTKD